MYEIPLNFGRTRQVDAYNGMTVSDFSIIAKNNFDVVLDDEVLHQNTRYHSDLLYYFNMWNDSLKQGAKIGAEPCFTSFMCAVSRGDC
jgi:hypothetical protein